MKIDILTLFPDMFAPLKESIIKRAVDKKLLEINIVDIREFSKDKHKKCDDYPFGGGAGMLMQVEPLYYAIKSVQDEKSKLIFPSPQGKVFNQNMAKELSEEEHLVFICGHYEGVDERIFELFAIEEISLGDFILTGGELPSMVMVDAISRLVDGVISRESLENESFSNGLLEYPQYTRPSSFMGLDVPEVLLSGNHQEIEKWRNEQSLKRTKERRKDLLKNKK
ncbi:MAG TPA: tRNA (guanosine(37)-N1)-methyltransferase TrmD [Candidatus Caccovivens faecavium]|nr:tRNA (guanosine(37)-N1)-methyltransferase TrmD [Candidatus Caccovivens faecavium]